MTATTADGSAAYTLQCPGSGGPSAQSLGVVYDMSPHRRCWVCATCSAAGACDCPAIGGAAVATPEIGGR